MARFDNSLINISIIGIQCQTHHLLHTPIDSQRMGLHSRLLSLPTTVASFCRTLRSNVTIHLPRHSRNSRKLNSDCQPTCQTSCLVLSIDMIESTSNPDTIENVQSRKTLAVVDATSGVLPESETVDCTGLMDEGTTSILLELASSLVRQFYSFGVCRLAHVPSF
jgi:hypothetical protein